MATTLAADPTPRFIVIKSKQYSDKGHAYFKAEAEGSGGSVHLGEADVFSTLVKMEAERSTSGSKYISLRFCYSNRYWVRKANSNLIVSESDQPEEDTTKPTCTLFEPVKVDDFYYLIHVQSGGRVLMDANSNYAFYVESNPRSDQGYLTLVDWDSLVNLPPRVAFKGDNGKYLQDSLFFRLNFMSDDPNAQLSIYVVEQSPDGNVRIKDSQFGYWWQVDVDTSLIYTYAYDPKRSQFWPLKIDENSIALRSIHNNNFCQRLTDDGLTANALSASASTITKEAIMQVQELVLERKMTNVTYQMEYGRIFNELPYVGGISTMTNEQYVDDSMSVEIMYEDQKSSTFTGGFSLTAGVSASIEAGVPFIEKATITVNYSATTTFEWANTKTTTTSVKAIGTAVVPARSIAVIEYVGTQGTCNIPFSYTQVDKSSTDAQISYTEVSDGIYTGVNCYNFNFHIRSVEPL